MKEEKEKTNKQTNSATKNRERHRQRSEKRFMCKHGSVCASKENSDGKLSISNEREREEGRERGKR